MDQGPPHKTRYTECDIRGSGGIALNSLALETTFWTGHPQLTQALETTVNTWDLMKRKSFWSGKAHDRLDRAAGSCEFSKDETQMAGIYVFTILSHQGNSNQNCQSERPRSIPQMAPHAGEDSWKGECVLNARGIANMYSHHGDQRGDTSGSWD